MVDPIIHQTHHSWDELGLLHPQIEDLQKRNIKYDYRFYTDEDMDRFIKTHYDRYTYWCYKKLNPKYGPAKADFFRYCVIYRCGGIYLDIKSTCEVPFRSLNLSGKLVLCHWPQPHAGLYNELKSDIHPSGKEFQNWHIISKKENPILKYVIEYMCSGINDTKYLNEYGKIGVLKITGPIMYTNAILDAFTNNKIEYIRNYYEIKDQRSLGLKYSVFPTHKCHYKLSNNIHYSKLVDKIIL